MQKRIPFVVSVEKIKGTNRTEPPSLNLFPECKTTKDAVASHIKEEDILFAEGYLHLPRTDRGGHRSETLLNHSAIVDLLRSDPHGEFQYVLYLWMNQILRCGIEIGKKLQRENDEKTSPLFHRPHRRKAPTTR